MHEFGGLVAHEAGCRKEPHRLPARRPQLRGGPLGVPRLADDTTVDHRHLVRANDPARRMARSDRAGLGAGEARRQGGWRFARLRGFIDVARLNPKGNVQSLQQFSPVA